MKKRDRELYWSVFRVLNIFWIIDFPKKSVIKEIK